MSSNLYRALKEAKVPDDIAIKVLKDIKESKLEVAKIRNTVKIMVGINIAFFVSILVIIILKSFIN